MTSPAVSPSIATIDQLMPVLASCTKNALTKPETEKILTIVDKNLGISSTEERKIGGKGEGIERSFLIGEKGECVILMTRTRVKGDTALEQGCCKTVKFCVNRKTGEKEVVYVSRDRPRTNKQNISYWEAWENLPVEKSFLELFRGEEEFVRFDFSVMTDHKIYFVMEYCNRGDLLDFTVKEKPSLKSMVYAIRDYLTGLVKMHAKGVLHRDLKLENLLLYQSAPDQPLRGKIADMGWACHMADEVAKRGFHGTPAWFPPERAQVMCVYNPKFSERRASMAAATSAAGDVFSMGCVLYGMACNGRFNFQQEFQEIASMSDSSVLYDLQQYCPHLDPEFNNLISKMVRRNPQDRCTAQEALDHFNTKIFSKMK